MKIAIIGSGNVGSGLARAAVAAGHSVTLSAATPGKAKEVADAVGASGADSNADAVNGAEVVILAVPGGAVHGVARELAPALSGKIVVDATNPLNATASDLDIEGTAAAQDLQRLIPAVPVVKAFNTLMAGLLSTPERDGTTLDGYVAGDDPAAKRVVAELLSSLGFRPVDAGGLRMARSLEEMAFLNIALNASNGWAWQTGWTLVGPTS